MGEIEKRVESERETRLEEVVGVLRKGKEGLERMVQSYKQTVKDLEVQLAKSRKDYLEVFKRELEGKSRVTSLEAEIVNLRYQLNCMKEKNERVQAQMNSLQNYVSEANQIRERFDANRIAKD